MGDYKADKFSMENMHVHAYNLTKQNMEDTKIEEGFKRCSRCGEVKPISEFYRNKRYKDGLMSECKACSIARVSEYNAIHKEEKKAYNAEYYQANKDAIRKQIAEYYQDNKKKIKAYNAEYYQENKDKKKAYNANYKDPQKNPMGYAKYMVKGYRQMDIERGFDDSKTITAEWFLENIMYRPCAHCGLLKVGAIGANRLNNNIGHEASNLEPCCMPCNSRLGAIDQIEKGLHWTCKHKKQSFKEFVKEHKKD